MDIFHKYLKISERILVFLIFFFFFLNKLWPLDYVDEDKAFRK